MLLADTARAVLMASIPAAYLLGVLSLPQLYLAAFLTGIFDVLFSVSYQALFVSMVPPERYVEGNSLINGSRAMSQVGGQSLAGMLVSLITAPGALVFNAASFLASAVALSRIRPQEPPTAAPGPGQLRAGIGFIARSPIVRAALGATATVNYFKYIFNAIFVLYVTTRLHVRPAELGLVLGAAAVGGVLGAAVTAPVSRWLGIGPAFVLSCVLFPAPCLLVPLAGGSHAVILALLFLAEFGCGVGVMILDISLGSIFAAVIPHALRSRVSGAYRTVNYGIRPLGALTGGALGTAFGLRPTLWFAAAGALLCVLWLLPGRIRHLKTLPATPEPALASV
jgi:predicted MFS family arabinose efflux permease